MPESALPDTVLPDKVVQLHLVDASGRELKTIELLLPTIACPRQADRLADFLVKSPELQMIVRVLLILALQSKPPVPSPTAEPNPNGGNLQRAN
jgi:hypothetical protein